MAQVGAKGGLDNIAEKMELADMYEEINYRLMLKVGKGDQVEQKKNPSIHTRINESTRQIEIDNDKDIITAFQFDYNTAYEKRATGLSAHDGTKIDLLIERAESAGIRYCTIMITIFLFVFLYLFIYANIIPRKYFDRTLHSCYMWHHGDIYVNHQLSSYLWYFI